MDNKANSAKRFYAAIGTSPVFSGAEQSVLKVNTQDTPFVNTNVAEWFPTDFLQDRLPSSERA